MALQDINPDHSLLTIPGTGYYRRTSDNLFVTECQGKAGVREALMGSDGSTTTEFPSIYYPRGFTFDGGDVISVPNNPLFSPTDGSGNDQPMSWACMVTTDTLTDVRFLIVKGVDIGVNREWSFYLSTKSIYMVIYGADGTSIGRRGSAGILDGLLHTLIATYSGSEANSGIKIYIDTIQVDDTDSDSGSYSGVTRLGSSVCIGSRYDLTFPHEGKIVAPMIFDTELSAEEVRVLTNRYREMYSIGPRR